MAISTAQLTGLTSPSQTPSEIRTDMIFDNIVGLEERSRYNIRLSATGLGLNPLSRWGWFNPCDAPVGRGLLVGYTPFSSTDPSWNYSQPFTESVMSRTYNGSDTELSAQLRGSINAPIGLPYFSNNDWTAKRLTAPEQSVTGKEPLVSFGTYIPFNSSFTLNGDGETGTYNSATRSLAVGVSALFLNSNHATVIAKFHLGPTNRPDLQDSFTLGDLTAAPPTSGSNLQRGFYPYISVTDSLSSSLVRVNCNGVTFNSGVPATVASTTTGVTSGNRANRIPLRDTLHGSMDLGTDSKGAKWHIVWATVQYAGLGGRGLQSRISIPYTYDLTSQGRRRTITQYVQLNHSNSTNSPGFTRITS